MPITDENAVAQACANIKLVSLSISSELSECLSAPKNKRLTTEQLLVIIRES